MNNFIIRGNQIINSTIESTLLIIKKSQPTIEAAKSTANGYYKKTVIWCGRALTVIPTIPDRIQKNNKLTVGAITSLNAIFFFFTTEVMKMFEKTLEHNTESQKQFKQFIILIDTGVIGMSTYAFNTYAIPALTHYHPSKLITVSLSIFMMLLRRPDSLEKPQDKRLQVE